MEVGVVEVVRRSCLGNGAHLIGYVGEHQVEPISFSSLSHLPLFYTPTTPPVLCPLGPPLPSLYPNLSFPPPLSNPPNPPNPPNLPTPPPHKTLLSPLINPPSCNPPIRSLDLHALTVLSHMSYTTPRKSHLVISFFSSPSPSPSLSSHSPIRSPAPPGPAKPSKPSYPNPTFLKINSLIQQNRHAEDIVTRKA